MYVLNAFKCRGNERVYIKYNPISILLWCIIWALNNIIYQFVLFPNMVYNKELSYMATTSNIIRTWEHHTYKVDAWPGSDGALPSMWKLYYLAHISSVDITFVCPFFQCWYLKTMGNQFKTETGTVLMIFWWFIHIY